MSKTLLTIAVAVIGYLLGTISTGILISKRSGVNIRNAGSKNTGASNVLRVLGVRKGILTFLGDALKAVLACLVGSLLLPGATFGIARFGVMIGGLAVIIGHNWPCFFHFQGGKGIAASTAVILFVDPLAGGIAIAVCVLVIYWKRYISLGSLTMLAVFAALTCALHFNEWFACTFAAILLALGIIRHRSNITRLVNGTENKIGKKVPADKQNKE
jgi:glycerol-3-phosphate acyltransferase PlsY